MVAAVVALVIGLVPSNSAIMLTARTTAVALALVAIGFLVQGQLQRSNEAKRAERARQMVDNDPFVAAVFNAEGQVLAANANAIAKFPEMLADGLSQSLSLIVANSDALLYRLMAQSDLGGGAVEDIKSGAARYRITTSRLEIGTYLWRLEDFSANSDQGNRAADALHIPMFTVSRHGAILFMNEACRALLGERPKTAAQIFNGELPESGETVWITGKEKEHSVVAAEFSIGGNRSEWYLLPTTQTKQVSTLAADWDGIEDLPVPLLKIAKDGNIIASNREARGLLGISDTTGKKVSDALDGLGRPIADWVNEAVEGRGNNVTQFLRGKGDNYDTFVQVTLNRAGSAQNLHLIAVLNDVTELKTLEAQFVQSQKMQAIGQLAGGVAHDFNNLLTAISGHCDLLLLRHDQGDHNYGDLIQIHQNANRAASLVGQLLAFSRKQNLQPEVIDLRETLSDLTHLLNRLVGEKLALILTHDQDLEHIRADKRQLEQVLMNLVVNARDAMAAGGEIKVNTSNLTLTKQWKRERAVVPSGKYVKVTVTDAGHGIPPDRLQKIFEPFYTTKRMGEGTGLGLSTAYGIVKQTGGFIFADSEVGKGTDFILLFPAFEVKTQPVAAPDFPMPLLATTGGDGVVLLVEDEAPVRAFASRALRLQGYTVLEADCAEAALELLADPELTVDLFVTDVIMPGMDGPTWVRQALDDRPDTRTVFVSGYAEDAFGDEGPSIPNSVFLPKPFSLTDLTRTVNDQLVQ